jgi:D-3-phosphoglycerate dehydrogenase
MKILVSDPIHEAGIKLLKKEGEVEVATGLSKEELIEKIRDKDALVIRSATKVTGDVIQAAERLKAIGRAGIGVDNIDLKAATKRGIVVVNAPEASSITVAEHTMGLILSLARKIPFADKSLKEYKWEKKRFLGVELRGKILGIIGLGKIGSQVAKKAKAFEMKILAYDPYVTEKLARSLGVKLVGLEELLSRSDFVTIHVPLTSKTKGMIGKKEIEKMKQGACLINCARGGIVDEKALYEGLKSGKLGGAALDVFEKEPPAGNPLLKLQNIVVTPHLGASTEEAQRHASTIACEEVLKVLRNQPPMYSVNMPVIAPEVLEELRDYLPLAEDLGRFSIQLLKGRITDISITYCGSLLKVKEFSALTNAALKGILDPILTEGINLWNAPVMAKNMGIRITEGRREDAGDYQNMIILKVNTDEEETEIKGALLGEEARIVGIEGYTVDLAPKGEIMLVKHEDRPGMIGRVALSLGENNINIGLMQVGRKEVGGIQLMVLTVDQKIPKDVLSAICAIKGIEKVKMVEMP